MKYKYQAFTSSLIYGSRHRGFTLIELMIVIVIIGVLSAIAVPSYRQYVVRNAELEAQAKMKQIEIELQRWRASALTYKNFVPKQGIDSNGEVVYSYDENDNTTIYVPRGRDTNNYNYKITLVDGTNTAISLVSAGGVDNVVGRSWKMMAEPNSKYGAAKKILLDSSGLQCKTRNNDSSIKIDSDNCGSYSEEW